MDRIETFERFKKIYAKKYKDFEEADKVFRIREVFF